MPAAKDGTLKRKGSALFGYFLPGFVFAVILLIALALYGAQTLKQSAEQQQSQAIEQVAQALGMQLEAQLTIRREQLAALARNPDVARLLQQTLLTPSERSARLQPLLPDALQVRLLGRDRLLPDPSGAAPLGYAGIDMLKQAMTGKSVKAEVHQLSSQSPYVALAMPVSLNGEVRGALFAAWPMQVIRAPFAAANAIPGQLRLRQGNSALLAQTAEVPVVGPFKQLTQPGSIWQLEYAAAPLPESAQSHGVYAVIAIAVISLLLVTVLGMLLLRRALKKDFASALGFAETLAEGAPAPKLAVQTRVASDVLLLMHDLIRQSEGRPSRLVAGQQRSDDQASAKDQANAQTGQASKAPADEEASLDQGLANTEVDPISPDKTAAEPLSVDIPAHIFRAYDIRGKADVELTADFARLLGRAFGEQVHEAGVKQVCVAHDARLSSPGLYEACIEGLTQQGLQVFGLGMVPAGLLAYAAHALKGSAAVMVTGSHNPPAYNGFKLALTGVPLSETAYQALAERMRNGGFAQREGWREQLDVKARYIRTVSEQIQLPRPLKVVVDAGNGAAGEVACDLFSAMGCEVIPLYCDPDGNFPNHHPNPGDTKTLKDLSELVHAQAADVGLAFDGDGDRLGLVDEQGELVWPEHLLMLLAGDILQRQPGADVLFDVKSSRHLGAYVLAQGGRPVMWQSGHSRMRQKMRETGAPIGGEFSGHLFIRDRWIGNDDAVYAAARLLEILAKDTRALSGHLVVLPTSPATPELALELDEGEPAKLVAALQQSEAFAGAKVIDIDGLRVELDEGWGLVRASNTTPSLTFRFEADTESALQAIQQRFATVIKEVVPGHDLPF